METIIFIAPSDHVGLLSKLEMELDIPAKPHMETIPFLKLWAVKRILGLVNVFGKLKNRFSI